MEERSQARRKMVGALVGALVAGLSFWPMTLLVASGLESLLFTVLGIDSSPNTDDLMAAFIFWLPAAALGMLGGLIGASLTEKRSGWATAITRSSLGGLFAALIPSLLMTGVVFWGWIQEGQEYRANEMRPESDLRIRTLSGSYRELTSASGYVEALAVSPDGSTLAYALNSQIILWNLEDNAQQGEPLVGHTDFVSDLTFSPDGHWLVSGSYDQSVIVWSVVTGERAHVLHGHHADYISVAVSPDSTLLATAGNDGNVVLWDLRSGQKHEDLESGGNSLFCLNFSPHGELLAACAGNVTGSDGVFLWDLAQRRPAGQLELPNWSNGTVFDVDFSPNGDLLAGAALFGPVVWDVEARLPLGAVQEIDTGNAIGFSYDGSLIVSTNDTGIYLWDVATREPIGKLVKPSGTVLAAMFLPDGRLLAQYRHIAEPNQSADCGLAALSTTFGIWTLDTP